MSTEPEIVEAEVVEDDDQQQSGSTLATLDHGTELSTYQPLLALTPEQASEQADRLRQIQAAVMKEGVDYGVIPGTNKPSLYKAGSEWLLKCFGFGHEFDAPEIEHGPDDRKWGVCYRARVTKLLPNGSVVTVATCEGSTDYDEDRFWEKPNCDCPWRQGRGRGKDHKPDCPREDWVNRPGWKRAPFNTLRKMAQKRALVGATLQATGTSGLFTQDVEDYRGSRQDSADAGESGSRRSADQPAGEALSSKPQQTLIHALLTKHKVGEEYQPWPDDLVMSDDEYRFFLAAKYRVDSSTRLSKRDASAVIEGLSDEDRRTTLVVWVRKSLDDIAKQQTEAAS